MKLAVAGNQPWVVEIYALPSNFEPPKQGTIQFDDEFMDKAKNCKIETFEEDAIRGSFRQSKHLNVPNHLKKVVEFENSKVLLVESDKLPNYGWDFTLFKDGHYICNICHSPGALIFQDDVYLRELHTCFPIPCSVIIQKYKDFVNGIKIDWKWWGKQQILHDFDYFDQPKDTRTFLETISEPSAIESVEYGPQRWMKLPPKKYKVINQTCYHVYSKNDCLLGWEFS
uniref:Uncharacterized protein n=1 Tax=Panagrolaimus sp. JU765 TaxID=591449 RepID=A0AC34Q1V1_9BILA